MAEYSLGAIAETLGGLLEGASDVLIRGVAAIEEAGPDQVSVVFDTRRLSAADAPRAGALVVPITTGDLAGNLIRVSNPRQALIQLLDLFNPPERRPAGVDPRALVSPHAQVSPDASVAAGVVIETGASIGARVQLYPHVYVGPEVQVGDDTVIFPNVTLYEGTRIGKRVRIHSGAVIGSDGFGYVQDACGIHHKIPQVGRIEIGDDVEIGANCTLDRATLGRTRIAAGTKIDNLVQVGHNVDIGRNCCIIAQVGISGSVRIGDFSVLAGQVGIADHVNLAERVIVGAQSGVMRDLEPGEWLGTPAVRGNEALKAYALIARLPEFRKKILTLEKRCAQLEALIERLQQAQSYEADSRA